MPIVVVKKVGNHVITFADIVSIYSAANFSTPDGISKILSIDVKNDKVIARPIKGNRKNNEYQIRQVLPRIRPLQNLNNQEIKNIVSLAMDGGFVGYKMTRNASLITLSTEQYRVEITLSSKFSVNVYSTSGKVETKNSGYIVTYLLSRQYDLFGLIRKGFAVQVNS